MKRNGNDNENKCDQNSLHQKANFIFSVGLESSFNYQMIIITDCGVWGFEVRDEARQNI